MPETSIDFVIGDPFKKSKPNARKLVLKTRAILRTPSACKNCMPPFSGHFIIFNIKFHPTGMHRLFGFTMNSLGNNRSEEHTSELQSLMRISYTVFGLKKKNK